MEQTYVKGKSKHSTVPKNAYTNLGINPDWNLEKAKERIRQLNMRNSLERKEQRKVTAIAKRIVKTKKIKSVFLPNDLVMTFHQKIIDRAMGSEREEKRLFSHWNSVVNIIERLKDEVL